MRARVLGSSAGGGLPQWNCGCSNCEAARDGRIEPRTQDSVLITTDDRESAFLLNASPDVLAQIARTPELRPRGLRATPISAVVLTSGDLDHCLGLLSLREEQPFRVYATSRVIAGLRERNALFATLQRSARQVGWHALALDAWIELPGCDGRPSGVELRAFALSGKPPRHLEGVSPPDVEDQIGLELRAATTTLVYASSAASTAGLAERFAQATCLLFDGTFYSSDELARLGIAGRRAEGMGHVPIAGPGGSLAAFERCRARRIYTHVNNTNPILARGSDEERAVRRAGWEIARDGMEIL